MAHLALTGGTPVRTKLFPPYNVIGSEEKHAVTRVLDSGVLSKYLGCWDDDFYGGQEVQLLEKEWAAYFGVKHAIAVNSCTSGLICAVGAIGIEAGDEVIVSPYTMSASATAPLWYGGIPIFADIDADTFCLDPKSVEKNITPYTKAILAVDIFGHPYPADEINEIAKKHNLIVIEDCAQAPGARYKNSFAGTLGDIGVYSLNYHKHIHTGEGGIVVTDNDTIAERVRLIRNHAEAVVWDASITDYTNMVGQNYRLTEIQAAMAREQLKKLASLNTERIKNSEYLAEKLGDIPGITFAQPKDNCSHVYYQQPFIIDEEILGIDRLSFIRALQAELPASEKRETEGPLVSFGYVQPLYLLPLFQEKIAFGTKGYPFNTAHRTLDYTKGICPVAEKLHEKELCLHELMRPGMSQSDLDDVVSAFKKVYQYREEIVS